MHDEEELEEPAFESAFLRDIIQLESSQEKSNANHNRIADSVVSLATFSGSGRGMSEFRDLMGTSRHDQRPGIPAQVPLTGPAVPSKRYATSPSALSTSQAGIGTYSVLGARTTGLSALARSLHAKDGSSNPERPRLQRTASASSSGPVSTPQTTAIAGSLDRKRKLPSYVPAALTSSLSGGSSLAPSSKSTDIHRPDMLDAVTSQASTSLSTVELASDSASVPAVTAVTIPIEDDERTIVKSSSSTGLIAAGQDAAQQYGHAVSTPAARSASNHFATAAADKATPQPMSSLEPSNVKDTLRRYRNPRSIVRLSTLPPARRAPVREDSAEPSSDRSHSHSSSASASPESQRSDTSSEREQPSPKLVSGPSEPVRAPVSARPIPRREGKTFGDDRDILGDLPLAQARTTNIPTPEAPPRQHLDYKVPTKTESPLYAPPAQATATPVQNGQIASKGERSSRKSSQTIVVNGKVYIRSALLGKGGSSRVYRVTDAEHNIFAIKKVQLNRGDEETYTSFCNEIQLLIKLKGHSRIIQLVDSEVNEQRKTLYMVMEVGEIDLNNLLQEKIGQRVSMNFVRHVWEQMLEAVKVVHDAGIVHTDLKPANFVLVRGALKLIDFGIAKAIPSDTTNIARDSQIGTANYMSPEALCDSGLGPRGERMMKLGRASDVWSLGCILYQMVYGITPFGHIRILQHKMMAIQNPKFAIAFPSHAIPTDREGHQVSEAAVEVEHDLLVVLRSCLRFDAKQRSTIPALLEDPFLRSQPSRASEATIFRLIRANWLRYEQSPRGTDNERLSLLEDLFSELVTITH
ncbi:uncharacterized protein L969DRAFT_91228 [Mixia osmundae IAM 14324]|uniref:Protein kinase domain-containing protein n=1 Tax=Mixia osmundae (strain CBS 9802 / IAM 14324 / JCM 22182 / KY 12970) TaxID=764103 RepID=G7DS02_MIXOS|nr:uncharacterized protein L969DRAFT_91228 [Mixia osmundae IAM 14324]KEI36153.1 hypothetical protein L969DRAFT_91228 [Mixia osmundae IAM 14324]GAA93362.1 hypothetical protein E5Q_00002 [Mixia osmundae IAM 14324]